MSRRRPALLVAAALLGALGALSACGSAKVRARSYYTLAYALSDDERVAETPTVPAVVRVREFDTELSYDRQQVVYRFSPYQLEFYNYHLWVAKPHRIVTEMVYKHLKHTNLFQQITLTVKEAIPDYEIDATVQAIEEFDSDTEWYAHLAMTFRVVDYKTRRIVWRHEFDKRKKVFHHDVIYVVRALSQILEEEMAVIVKGSSDAIAADLASRGADAPTPAAEAP